MSHRIQGYDDVVFDSLLDYGVKVVVGHILSRNGTITITSFLVWLKELEMLHTRRCDEFDQFQWI